MVMKTKTINDKTTQYVDTIVDLSNLLVRKNNQKVIVNNRYTYQYDKDSVEPIDGIYSVEASNSIGRWILQNLQIYMLQILQKLQHNP